MVFRSYALFPHMSVAQNVSFGLARRGVRGAGAARQVERTMEMVRPFAEDTAAIAEILPNVLQALDRTLYAASWHHDGRATVTNGVTRKEAWGQIRNLMPPSEPTMRQAR